MTNVATTAQHLSLLNPQPLWGIFAELCAIPRPSKSEEAALRFVCDFGARHGLEASRDTAGNAILRKQATPGFEDRPTIVMQGHADMVPQKTPDSPHDFHKDPIEAIVEGGWVRARDTTLGADNGIGVAAALAIMTDAELRHGPLEVLITRDEETGMTGANGLKDGTLKADIMLNLDSETEGEIYVGCAGGLDLTATFDITTEPTDTEDVAYRIRIAGGHGGHSGMDIHLGVANANKLLARFLKIAAANFESMLADIQGGGLRNAIPREASAVVTICADDAEEFEETVQEFEEIVKNEYASTDPSLSFSCERVPLPANVFTEMCADDLINAIQACPSGVVRMSSDMPGLVQTSLNMASVNYADGRVNVCFLLRSSSETEKEDLASSVESLFRLAGAKVEMAGSYPGWQPNVNSRALALVSSTHKRLYGSEPRVMSVHAGLECGIIGCKYPSLDMVSFGPTIVHPHSPAERVSVESVERFYRLLREVVEQTALAGIA